MTTTISSLIFVTYTSLYVASLNAFKRSVAIANSDPTTLDEELDFIERVSLCYRLGRLNRRRRLARSTAYHYFFYKEIVAIDKADMSPSRRHGTAVYKAGVTHTKASTTL